MTMHAFRALLLSKSLFTNKPCALFADNLFIVKIR